MRWLILPLLAVWSRGASAACPTSNEQIRDHLDVAALAYASSRGGVLASERAEAEAELACLGQPLSPDNAAAWHQMVALDCSMKGDLDCALRSLRAAAAASPGWQIPDAVAPPEHAIRQLHRQASAGRVGQREPVEIPAGYALYLDGQRAATRPSQEPVVAQAFDPGGYLLWGAWVDVGQELPAFPQPKRRSPLLFAAAGATLGASGAMWLGARAAEAQLEAESAAIAENRRGSDPDATLEAMQATRARADALGRAAQVGAGVGLGLGVVAFTVRF